MFRIFHRVRWAVKTKKTSALSFLKKKQGLWFFVVFRYQDDTGFDRSAHVAQLVEHILGKDEVISSILIMGSILRS